MGEECPDAQAISQETGLDPMFDHPVPSTCWPYTSAACVMMGRPLRRFTLALVWVLAFVSPAIAEDGLIYFLTPASVQLFDTASEKDEFWPLIARFVSERRETFCGVASSVMVLNALGITPPPTPEWYPNQYWTQENIFTAAVLKAVPPPVEIEGGGLTLGQVATLLRTSGAKVETVFAQDTNVGAFRSAATAAMHRADTYVIVNVLRARLDQGGVDGGGHISPLGAYTAELDHRKATLRGHGRRRSCFREIPRLPVGESLKAVPVCTQLREDLNGGRSRRMARSGRRRPA
jgi:hypothetical protein